MKLFYTVLLLTLFTIVLYGQFTLNQVGQYQTGLFDEGAAEIVQYDPITKRAFFTNAAANTLTVLDVADPTNPVWIADIDQSPYGSGVNSVAVANNIVAVAVEGDDTGDRGVITFWSTTGEFIDAKQVGFLPDMVTFDGTGTKVIVANEGEPSDDYTLDPEGSISIIDISSGVLSATISTIDFNSLNAQEASLRSAGVRIFGPNASVAQDLEPEYIAVAPDNTVAYVVCQENNAIVVVDLFNQTLQGIVPLGFKDHSVEGNGLDASNRDDAINIKTWPIFGMYQPDAIATVEIDGDTYILSANEGDARDYDGFSEEERMGGLTLDPTVFPNASELQDNAQLGRLLSTTALGDTDGDGDHDILYSYGARSFSIWDASGNLVWDSGDAFEQLIAEIDPANFNSNNDENDSRDSRSDDKGPEPEAIAVGVYEGRTLAFIGLERVGGIMVYDITDPMSPQFITYENTRDFSGDLMANGSDAGVEHISFVKAEDSPTGNPMLIVSNEVSGTISLMDISGSLSTDNAILADRVSLHPNPALDFIRFEKPFTGWIVNHMGQPVMKLSDAMQAQVSHLESGNYVLLTRTGSAGRFVIVR